MASCAESSKGHVDARRRQLGDFGLQESLQVRISSGSGLFSGGTHFTALMMRVLMSFSGSS